MVFSVRQRFTYDAYLQLEAESGVKHEFLDGHVWAMAGGTIGHSRIAANIIGLLVAALRDRPCIVLTSDARIRVRPTGLATYPDVSVVCGAQDLDVEDRKGETIANPIVIVEVLSPSTEEYDRGEKVAHYKQIASLREILLIAHDEQRVERWRRDGDHWTLDVVHGDGSVELASLGAVLTLADVYRNPLA